MDRSHTGFNYCRPVTTLPCARSGNAISAGWSAWLARSCAGTRCGAADEEDVALSVFDSFCRGLEEGRFPNLQDRDNLWKVLVVLTARKALRLVQYERRQKRGGGKVLAEADLSPVGENERALLDGIVGREPSPEFAAQVAEECNQKLALLGNDTLRSIARWKVEGDTNAEIAVKLDCLERTVEQQLRTIRDRWEKAS